MDLKNHIKYDNVINKIDELAKETIQFKRTAGEVAAIVQELEPNTKDISLNNVLENAVEAAQRYSKLKSTQINLNLEDNLPKIEGRYWSLVHAFTNIIVNAAQAISDKGFITLSTFKTTDARICCKISDTGRGIKKEYLPKLFDPFYSGWQEKKRIGLGLAVTQRIIKHFGGEVKVESEENKGSEFTICLPYV